MKREVTSTLSGLEVVVSAGGTREAIDPVRFIGNRSSGRQGYAFAEVALVAGANVSLVSTVENLPIPYGAKMVKVESASDMSFSGEGSRRRPQT
ncbi:protein containing DNA/pantothenate metabolism flavoprotein [mine drainage metagenome]|uniref:Protein containing DNA/pantothenate metabolism flavoprotein n=1 Tax=mine drainage metagenome TaxID=410659 RepID=T0XVS4_9ZZZZ